MKKDFFILREYNNYSSITEAIKSSGHEIENIVLEQDIVEANYYISKQLSVPLATKLFYLKKIRYVDSLPRSIEKVYIDLDEVKGLEKMDFNNVSFYEILHKEKGINKLHIKEEIMLVEPNEEERKLLKLEDDEKEILLIKGISIKENDKPLEYYELSSDTNFYRYRSVSVYEQG